MPELLENFSMGVAHAAEKCPFCPAKKNDEHYKTYGGAANDCGKLGDLVNEPGKFGTSIEADARPKDGKEGKDGRQNQDFTDTDGKKFADIKGTDTEWKFQAHHAISGNQCLKGHPVEKFIIAGDELKYDSGYSVNNPQNGIWMPSFPETGTAWPADPAKKFALAKIAMDKFRRQFHLGHHNISIDADEMDTETDEVYADYVKRQLQLLHVVLDKWARNCKEQDEEKKHFGNARIHSALDHISEHIKKKLEYPVSGWNIFVSRHARDLAIKTRNPKAKLDFER